MKGFSQFLVEAETSQAAAQAKRLQLTSDGHGGWTDRTGKYVAKTEKGKLVFFKGRGKAGEEEPEEVAGDGAGGRRGQVFGGGLCVGGGGGGRARG